MALLRCEISNEPRSYTRVWRQPTAAPASVRHHAAMNIKLIVPKFLAAAVLLPGAFVTNASAGEPVTAVNSTNIVPGDANVPTVASQTSDDIRVTQQIRDALVSDGTIAADVKHLVMIATNGQAVVLRGALPTTGDINRVQTLAQQFAGSRQVINELTVIDF
jgi:osmotically-inducible protein OsmY